MPKARLYFDGDNTWIEKNARIYSLTQDVGDKLDSIPNVIDNTSSTSTTDALSANMGRDLQEQINNLASRGRFLSTWDCTTWLPTTQPQTSPYVYRAWDYYIVSATWATNYRPHGSEYTTWVASTTVETLTVDVNDLYIYDWVQWTLQWTWHWTSVAWWTIVWNIADQADLQIALFEKADKVNVLEKNNTTSYTPTADYHPATKKYTDDNDTYIGTSAPTNNVVEWRLWYDTANDVLKVYDWSQWVPTGKTYTAWSHINISNADVISTTWLQEELTAWNNISIDWVTINARDTEYTEWSNITITCPTESDMKWPCPSWFHVPLESERQWVIDIMNALTFTETWDERYIVNLHMPMCWMRNNPTSISNVGQWRSGWMWLSSYATTWQDRYSARQTRFEYIQNRYTCEWYVIRPMKNSFVIPDNNWTVINWVLWGAWIFWNQVDWIISITSDWNTGYTIADKNLWATVVYNNWDTYSEANCGRYYQWGNNYWFPWIWNTETILSTTNKPSVTWYWPWNYYYSDVFVVASARTWTQEEPVPKNLRWWVSQSTWQDCEHPIISATDTTYTASDFDIKDLTDSTNLRTTWSWKQDALTAWDNITIQDECTTESDMKWPAPSGFHVPSTAEWQTVYNIWTALGWGGADWTNFWIALKLPFAGNRNYSSANVSNQGTDGYYWSSSQYDANNAYYLYFYSTVLNPQNHRYRTYGFSIRCFKNTPTIPASSWVKLYWTSIENWWIFWNSVDWLISLSSDWQTWITIADKNLWATTVWNNGDALSEANCWKHYQWGNNYGFPRTWGITTSSTQVDASNYWPWNYYSSSTFITYNGRWDSTDNWNLWWWVTQWTWQKCIYNVISATDTTYVASDFDIKDLTDSTNLRTTWSWKQDALTAWSHIDITSNVVSTTGLQEELVAWDNITIWDECTTESDMKWPCSSGFHIWTSAEWATLKNTWVWLWQDGAAWDVFAAKFKIPFGNYRWAWTNANTSNQWTNGMYWTSTPSSGYSAYFIVMRSWYFSTTFSYARTYGFSVRPFKNTPVAPDSTWTTILDWSSVATWAWIFYNAIEWLISASSNWTTWITIADKNVWATVAWNEWDALSADNCGWLFQWWNNYMFPFSWTVSGTATLVDTTGYWPGNYYYSDLFNTTYQDWASPNNDNLRWWVSQWMFQDCIHNVISATDTTYTASDFDIKDLTDSTGLRTTWSWKQDALTAWSHIDITSNVVSTRGLQEELVVWDNVTIVALTEDNKKWPCPSGFHVPTMFDWEDLIDIWTTLGWGSTDWDGFWVALKLPKAGSRDYSNGTLSTQWVLGLYWTCSAAASDAINLSIMSNDINSMNAYWKADALPVRAFKNTSVTPDNTWTMLYWTSIAAGWIFWNNAEWLISLSSDWSNWKTIQDKNLWATTVWNNWDTLSEANCGKYYQWWNNYWFAWIWGTVSVSSTQVDASWYGPGNYYSSSTYIISNSDWSSVQNDNLWWWTRQWTWQSNPIISADVSLEYADEHWPVIPVYYYSGDFNNDITFNIVEAWEYRLYVKAYHETTVDKTLTLTVDNVTVGTLTSNLIEHLNASINFTASAWSTAVLSVSSKTNFTIQEVYIEKVNIQSGYVTATVN